MIRCKKGKVTMEGTGCMILSEVAVVLRAAREMASEAYEDEKLADELIEEALQMSRMSDKEVEIYKRRKVLAFLRGGGYINGTAAV